MTIVLFLPMYQVSFDEEETAQNKFAQSLLPSLEFMPLYIQFPIRIHLRRLHSSEVSPS